MTVKCKFFLNPTEDELNNFLQKGNDGGHQDVSFVVGIPGTPKTDKRGEKVDTRYIYVFYKYP